MLPFYHLPPASFSFVTFKFETFLISSYRPKSTPTPTGSLNANGVPTESVDYDRLKQVGNGNLDTRN